MKFIKSTSVRQPFFSIMDHFAQTPGIQVELHSVLCKQKLLFSLCFDKTEINR